MITIKIKNVTKKFKENVVIDNISMELESGDVVGFRGINGSGKTMLMRLVAGLIYPTKGEIEVKGKILGKDIDFPESIGLLIENPAFLDGYSGFQNLKMLASIQQKVSDEEIKIMMRKVGLEPENKKKYKKYSLGMKQRLGIAGAVLEKPELIILDEPTNALDTAGIEMLKQVVKEEKERGAMIIISCHDTGILEELADKIYFLENGRVKKSEVLQSV